MYHNALKKFLFNICLVLGYNCIVSARDIQIHGVNEDNNDVVQIVHSRIRRSDHHYHSHHHDSHHLDYTDETQYCILYSNIEGDVTTGASIVIRHDVSDLEELGWKRVVSSVQCFGLWVFYKVPGFNANGTGGVGYFFKNEPQFVPLTGDLWSHWDDSVVGLRRVGPREDPFMTDTITVFEHEWYSGQQYYAHSDIPKLPMRMNDKTSSVIITGGSDWTIYEHAEFRGESECLRHEDDGSVGLRRLLVLDNKVTSIKKGC